MFKTPVDYIPEPQVVKTIGHMQVVEVFSKDRAASTFKVHNGRRILGGEYGNKGDAVAFCHQQEHRPESLEEISNLQLAKQIEKRDAAKQEASSHVYDLAESGDERYGDIVARLSVDDPAVVAAQEASEQAAIARGEARRRLGPVPDVSFVAYLKNNRRKGM